MLLLALHVATILVVLLAIPAVTLPWQVWTNSEVNRSGANAASVSAWGPLTSSNIPYVAVLVGVVALVAVCLQGMGWLHRTAGWVSVIGGLWIGLITVLDVMSMPNDAVVHSVAGSGVYLAAFVAAALVVLGAVVASRPT